MKKQDPIWSDAQARNRLLRIALMFIDSPSLAEEIVQEAYLRLMENDVNDIEVPLAWLTTVTRNLAIDQARRLLRERKLLRLVPETGLSQYNPEAHDEHHSFDSRLSELVSGLLHVSNSVTTAMVLLHVVFGLSYKDIAIASGRSPTACRQAASRALRRCYKHLEEDEQWEKATHTDLYVHAILNSSMPPLIDSLNMPTPVSLLGVTASVSASTEQVLVITADGVQWALVLNGHVLIRENHRF